MRAALARNLIGIARLAAVTQLAVHSAAAGAVQAIHIAGLVRWARENECVVVLHHRVGDFVPTGAILIDLYGEAAGSGRPVADPRPIVGERP